MTRLNIPPAEALQDSVQETFNTFKELIGMVPKPLEMMSVSPVLLETQLKRIEYFNTHPNLSFALLAHIRFCVSKSLDYSFCTDLNGMMLQKLGLTDEQIEETGKDPSKSLLEDNEKAMLVFVMKSIKTPALVTDQDIDDLRKLDWTDQDIFDALAQGVGMKDHALMMQVFQIDQSCLI